MSGYQQFGLLFLAVIGTFNCATIGRDAEIENGHKYYENNPFFNFSHYPGHHHHHHDFDFHNSHMDNGDTNSQYPEKYNDMEDDFPNRVLPKTTTRRDATDDVSDYPYEAIKKFLNENPLYKQYFSAIPIIGNRHGGESDDVEDDGESLCKTQTIRTYHPQKLKNINDIEKVIVNDKEEYTQGIEEKICVSKGKSCSIPFDSFGYTSYCQQNFDVKRLMIVEESKLVFDEFRIPSCCVCKIKKTK